MIQMLTDQQAQWVEATLNSLSLEQCIAQLLCVSQGQDSKEYWLRLIEEKQIGCMRARTKSAQTYHELLLEAQKHSPIPLLVPANMEFGAAELRGYGTEFPLQMAAGAADDEALMSMRGQAIATEARHIGVNWVFNPVVDLNYNFDNPITNIRSLGDDPDRVSRLACAQIRALQQYGLAATAKHFPGDGIDDRDQHLLTTVNSLPFDQWMETYGRVWKAVIDAGVMCIMPGHISLPDYQGYAERPESAPPATLSRKLLVDLLRQDLGFDGLIVSDNASMIGLTSRASADERVVKSIASGIDVYLNADPDLDYERLVQAVRDGRLSEERVRQSARRVLEMKARINLFENPFGPAPTSEQTAAFRRAAEEMAEKSITVLRGGGQLLPEMVPPTKVLTVTYARLNPMMGMTDLETFDQELRERGFQVEHLLNPDSRELRRAAREHDVVFINLYQMPMTSLGSARLTSSFRTWGWRSLFVEHPAVAYTAFGNPYVAYELPHVPNLLATYGGSDVSQRAAVKVWLGETEAQGTVPVRMPQVQIRPLPYVT
jgi:beta-N-acetylhexosaminidase